MRAVFFIALPYLTADLHIGRLMGTFLPADVLKRYYRLFKNKKAVLVSGLDCYGTSVYKELKKQSLSKDRYFLDKEKNFYRTLDLLGIKLWPRFKTLDHAHKTYVNDQIRALIQSNVIYPETTAEHYCVNCDMVLADRFLQNSAGVSLETLNESFLNKINKTEVEDLRCTFCKMPPILKDYRNLFLRYDRSKIKQYEQLNKLGESEKQISRSFLHWGVPGASDLEAFNGNKYTYYVWIEALLSYPEIFKRLKMDAQTELKYFYGKDNDYYHRVIYPCLLTQKQSFLCAKNANVVKRNYVVDKTERKFSSSEKNFLTVTDFDTLNYDVLRFGLSYEDCLSSDSVVTKEKIRENCALYVKKFVNTGNRLIALLKKYRCPTRFKKDGSELTFLDLKQYHTHMNGNNLKNSLSVVLNLHNNISAQIDQKIRQKDHQFACVADQYLQVLNLLWPFTPKTCELLKKRVKKLKKIRYCKETFKIF